MVLTVLIALLLGFGLYRAKTLAGVDIIRSFSWERFGPLKRLHLNANIDTDRVVEGPRADRFIESFDGAPENARWSPFWSERPGAIQARVLRKGRFQSHCLVVDDLKGVFWSCSIGYLVRAAGNERFKYEAWVRREAGVPKAGLSLIVLDKDKKVMVWNEGLKEIQPSRDWVRLLREVSVPAGAAYVRFMISGTGRGVTLFDDICFQRVPARTDPAAFS